MKDNQEADEIKKDIQNEEEVEPVEEPTSEETVDKNKEAEDETDKKKEEKKPFLKKVKKKEKKSKLQEPEYEENDGEDEEYEEEEYDEEYEDEDDDDEEYEESGKGKIILISVIVAALIAAGGVITYQKIKSNNDEQRQEQLQEQTNNITATPEAEQEEANPEASEAPEEEVSTTPIETATPIPTSTPKPLPTETPTPTPFQDSATDTTETAQNITDDTETISNLDGEQQEAAGVIFLGDSRFRAMANIATGGSDLWECSSSGDYSWMTGTAFSDVDAKVGNNTKVFINMGINDILNYQAYAAAINAKAQEWQAKGASVYFVAVGPVSETSTILNTDIATFNTYMYNNLSIPFIDAYNYLVENGFETTDGQTYTDTTSTILYSYLNGLIGR